MYIFNFLISMALQGKYNISPESLAHSAPVLFSFLNTFRFYSTSLFLIQHTRRTIFKIRQ